MPREDDGLIAEIAMNKGWLDAGRLHDAIAARLGAGRPVHPLVDTLLEDRLLTPDQARQIQQEMAARQADPNTSPSETPSTGASAALAPAEEVPAAPKLAPWWRTVTTAAWVAACAAVVGLLASLASTSPRPAGKENPRRSAAGAKKRLPSRPPKKAPEPGKALAEAALAFDRKHPKEHAAALLQLRRGALATTSSSLADALATRLTERRDLLDSAAGRTLAALDKRLAALKKESRYGDALRACAALPAELRGGRWGAELEARFANVAAEGETRYLQLVTQAAQAMLSHDFAPATGAYQQVGKLGIPWMTATGARLLDAARNYAATEQARLGQLVQEHARRARRRTFGQLAAHFARIEDHVRSHRYDKAVQQLKDIPEALRQGDAGAAVARLEQRVALLRGLWKAIVKGPKAAMGKEFRLHGLGGRISSFIIGRSGLPEVVIRIPVGQNNTKSLPRRIDRLPLAQLLQLAQWAVADDPPADAALSLGVFLLTAQREKEAREKLTDAKGLGAGAAPYLKEFEAKALVEKGLAAHREDQWAEARKLLESALDEYTETSHVISRHREITKALHRCLEELGLPTSPQPLRPGPLPIQLRRIRLLPETRLGPARLADPLAAHFGTPLERTSPLLLGSPQWRSYQIALDYTPGARLVLLARLSEPQPGRFAFYALTLDGSRVTLALHVESDRLVLDQPRKVPELMVPRPQRVVFSLIGNEITVTVNSQRVLRTSNDALKEGRIGVVAPDAEVRIQQLAVLFPTPK